MIRVFICSILTITANYVFAQNEPPIFGTNRQKGIYRDFQEFLNNSPSIQTRFMVLLKSDVGKIEKGTADYRLMLLDTATKKRDLRKFWGVYDGENVYINEVVYGGHVNFKKMHGFGRYCYFKGSLTNNGGKVGAAAVAGGLVGGVIAATIIEIDGDYPYILNVNNGQIYLLDKETLRIILRNDQELLTSYEEGERKGRGATLLSYIVKYNERHADEIKYNKPEPVAVIFYRKGRKERIEPIDLMIGDTTRLSLAPGSLGQVTSYNDSLDVCIGSKCRTIPLQKKATNYIECSWKSEEQEFNSVEKKVGQFYEREIRMKTDANENVNR